MVLDPRKRQKKLARRKAKQRARRRELAPRDSGSLSFRLERAAAAPILHCCTTAEIWEEGMGQVLVSRQLHNGSVAFVLFLVDMYCLGVKDVMMHVSPRLRYDRELYGRLAGRYALTELRPECARKLVEGAVRYALDLGFPSHEDYRTARLIFGDIAAEDCTEEFVFGKDGKPRFIAGPYDSPARCQDIIRTLHSRCGPDGYHYLIPCEELPPV